MTDLLVWALVALCFSGSFAMLVLAGVLLADFFRGL